MDKPKQQETVTANELIDMANEALTKMSNRNPHKRLIYMLGLALSSLAQRYGELVEQIQQAEKDIRAEKEAKHGSIIVTDAGITA